MKILELPARRPNVPLRRYPLSEQAHARQVQRGLFTTERGEPFAFPVDDLRHPRIFEHRDLWRIDRRGRVHRAGVRWQPPRFAAQRRVLEFLRDRVDERIPQWWYLATLGHDLHVSTWGDLYGKHWHAGWANPFTGRLEEPLDHTFETWPDHPGHVPKMGCGAFHSEYAHGCLDCEALWRGHAAARNAGRFGGFVEHLGWLSGAKVTTAFVSEEIDELTSATSSEYADFDFHEVGTSSAAEANTQTALTTSTGIARATGSPTDADPIYRNVGTVTADATESFEEHGLFNNSTAAAMMDRSLTGGQSVVSGNQVQYTYELTKNAEA